MTWSTAAQRHGFFRTLLTLKIINVHYLDVLRIRTTRSVQDESGRITIDERSFTFFLSTTHIFRGAQPEGERDRLMGLGYVHNVRKSSTVWNTLTILHSLLAWSSVLIFLPRLLLFAAGQSLHLTPLESFLALHFGLFSAFSAVGLVINVMAFRDLSWMCHLIMNRLQIPSNSTDPGSSPACDNDSATHPLILPITSFLLLSAFLSYNTTNVGSLPKLYSACTGLAGIWGLWVVSGLYLLDHLSTIHLVPCGKSDYICRS